MTPTPNTSTERALIRTVAGATRKLDEDLNLSPLQAIDRLQKLHERFHEHWIRPSPWLVLEDCWTLPASMPVAKMLEDIQTHGKPIGIVGAAWLESVQRDVVLRMSFRRDEKSRKTIEISAQAAVNEVKARRQAVISAQVFLDASRKEIAMRYSFNPDQAVEPGFIRVGSIVYSSDRRVRCYFQNKGFADVMEQSKERFQKVVKKLEEIQKTEGLKR